MPTIDVWSPSGPLPDLPEGWEWRPVASLEATERVVVVRAEDLKAYRSETVRSQTRPAVVAFASEESDLLDVSLEADAAITGQPTAAEWEQILDPLPYRARRWSTELAPDEIASIRVPVAPLELAGVISDTAIDVLLSSPVALRAFEAALEDEQRLRRVIHLSSADP